MTRDVVPGERGQVDGPRTGDVGVEVELRHRPRHGYRGRTPSARPNAGGLAIITEDYEPGDGGGCRYQGVCRPEVRAIGSSTTVSARAIRSLRSRGPREENAIKPRYTPGVAAGSSCASTSMPSAVTPRRRTSASWIGSPRVPVTRTR